METYPIGIALLLAAWAYIGIVLWLGPGLWLNEALVSGFVTGIIIGNIPLGLSVGVTMTLLSLGPTLLWLLPNQPQRLHLYTSQAVMSDILTLPEKTSYLALTAKLTLQTSPCKTSLRALPDNITLPALSDKVIPLALSGSTSRKACQPDLRTERKGTLIILIQSGNKIFLRMLLDKITLLA